MRLVVVFRSDLVERLRNFVSQKQTDAYTNERIGCNQTNVDVESWLMIRLMLLDASAPEPYRWQKPLPEVKVINLQV